MEMSANKSEVTSGITAWCLPRVHIDGGARDLDVGLSHPRAVQGTKGSTVRRLKRYMI